MDQMTKSERAVKPEENKSPEALNVDWANATT